MDAECRRDALCSRRLDELLKALRFRENIGKRLFDNLVC